MEPLRWGIIGTGRIAQTFARDLTYGDDGVVVAVGSRSSSSAATFGDEFDVSHRHGSYEALVADPDVEAVYVATPHPMHHANAVLALDAGKAVLVEKAFTMTVEEATNLVAIARARGLFLMEAMWTRFLPHVVALRELITAGELGDIVSLVADHGKWFERDASSRLFAPELGGSAMLDLGVYPVSFASMIMGAPTRVSAMVTPSFTGVDATASAILGYDHGAQALITCTSSARSATRASVVGTLGRIEIDGDFYAPTSFTLVPRVGQARRYTFETQGRGLHFQASHVAARMRAGETESDIMPLDETVEIMRTMLRIMAA